MPIVFYQQIEEYKAANVDPEELVRLAKDIYDRFVMRNMGVIFITRHKIIS